MLRVSDPTQKVWLTTVWAGFEFIAQHTALDTAHNGIFIYPQNIMMQMTENT